MTKLELREIRHDDPPIITAAFAKHGWDKPETQYRRYLKEQEAEKREVILAFFQDEFAGYGTIVWESSYPPFREANMPSIVDLNVLPQFRRHGIATAIMDEAEMRMGKRSDIVGIGVGLYADYGPAQRMYVLRGYVPDAKGATWGDKPVMGDQPVVADDDLILWLTKVLR